VYAVEYRKISDIRNPETSRRELESARGTDAYEADHLRTVESENARYKREARAVLTWAQWVPEILLLNPDYESFCVGFHMEANRTENMANGPPPAIVQEIYQTGDNIITRQTAQNPGGIKVDGVQIAPKKQDTPGTSGTPLASFISPAAGKHPLGSLGKIPEGFPGVSPLTVSAIFQKGTSSFMVYDTSGATPLAFNAAQLLEAGMGVNPGTVEIDQVKKDPSLRTPSKTRRVSAPGGISLEGSEPPQDQTDPAIKEPMDQRTEGEKDSRKGTEKPPVPDQNEKKPKEGGKSERRHEAIQKNSDQENHEHPTEGSANPGWTRGRRTANRGVG